jgi:hypothetical protein
VHEQGKQVLLGLGLDNNDGHTRVTHGENFHLFGGSEDTHERMQEHAIKINEKLHEREKTLDTVSHDELREIVNDVVP